MLAIGIIAAPAELLIANSPPGVIAAAILATLGWWQVRYTLPRL